MENIKKANKLFLFLTVFYIISSIGIRLINRFISINMNISLILSQLIIMIPIAVYLLITKTNPLRLIQHKKLKISTIILLVLFSYLITPLVSFINFLSMLVSENQVTEMLESIIDNSLVLNLALIALMPAFVEEFVFRGVFYHSYRKKSIWAGIVASGVLFGLIHLNFNQFSYAFVLGMIFALLIEATESIFAPMLCHFIFNANSVLLSNFSAGSLEPAADGTEQLQSAMGQLAGSVPILLAAASMLLIIATLSTLAAIAIYRRIAKTCERDQAIKTLFSRSVKDGSAYEKVKIVDIYLLAGIAICIVIMIWL